MFLRITLEYFHATISFVQKKYYKDYTWIFSYDNSVSTRIILYMLSNIYLASHWSCLSYSRILMPCLIPHWLCMKGCNTFLYIIDFDFWCYTIFDVTWSTLFNERLYKRLCLFISQGYDYSILLGINKTLPHLFPWLRKWKWHCIIIAVTFS